MAKNDISGKVMTWVIAVASIALVLLVMLILFGNLSGNVGFAEGTAGYNNTQAVIGNYTTSATNTAAQFPVVGTIVGVALLLAILIGLLVYAIKKMTNVSGKGEASFG